MLQTVPLFLKLEIIKKIDVNFKGGFKENVAFLVTNMDSYKRQFKY